MVIIHVFLYCNNCHNLQVMLVHVDSAPALKCNGVGLESWLTGHLGKGNVYCTLKRSGI